jgi:hypothetical protein
LQSKGVFLTVEFHLAEARVQKPPQSTCFHQWALPDGSKWTQFHRTDGGYLLHFPGLSDFLVSQNGKNVTCFPAPQVTQNTAKHLYLNQVLPLALAKQGQLVLHASAVEIDEYAVAFLGESGRGKSTLAASFAANGLRFLTDDGLLLERCDTSGYQVMPSHPSIRLWDDSQQALISMDVAVAPPVQFTSKARFLAGEGIIFCDQSRQLRRIYFLGLGTAPKLTFERVKPAEALIELVKHSFLLDIEERDMLAAQFDEFARLVSQQVCYRLDYPRRYEDLAFIRQAIVEHAMNEDQA